MTTIVQRDAVVTAAIFCFFASAWFGWTPEAAASVAQAAHRRLGDVAGDGGVRRGLVSLSLIRPR